MVKLLNMCPHTLRRTPGGHRRYKESQMMALIGRRAAKKPTEMIEQEVAAGENHG